MNDLLSLKILIIFYIIIVMFVLLKNDILNLFDYHFTRYRMKKGYHYHNTIKINQSLSNLEIENIISQECYLFYKKYKLTFNVEKTVGYSDDDYINNILTILLTFKYENKI